MKTTLTKERRDILNILRQNCRTKNTEISRKTNLRLSTVNAIIKSLEKNLDIRYVPLLDYSKLGHNTRTAFLIEADNPFVVDFLDDHENVNSIFRTGEKRFMVEMIFQSMKDMAEFAEQLRDMGADIKNEFYIVEELRREGFVV